MEFTREEVLVVIPGRISLWVILPFYSVVIWLWACKGNLVLFWEDLWLVEGALKILFPRLYAFSSNHFGCVSSFVDSYVHLYNWNFGFRRNLNGVEVDELSRLLHILERVRLFQHRDDRRSWKLDRTGLFSCKSYNFFSAQQWQQATFIVLAPDLEVKGSPKN